MYTYISYTVVPPLSTVLFVIVLDTCGQPSIKTLNEKILSCLRYELSLLLSLSMLQLFPVSYLTLSAIRLTVVVLKYLCSSSIVTECSLIMSTSFTSLHLIMQAAYFLTSQKEGKSIVQLDLLCVCERDHIHVIYYIIFYSHYISFLIVVNFLPCLI